MAITTTGGTEDWLCVQCLSLEGGADEPSAASVAPYTLDLGGGQHAAVAAGWAARLSLPGNHWARIRNDGRTLDLTCPPGKIGHRNARLRLGQTQTLTGAPPEVLRLWPVSSIQNDRRANAAILGHAEARSTGTLLQQLMAPAALQDVRRLTPLQSAASIAGGYTTL
jgi:hypothetical protein